LPPSRSHTGVTNREPATGGTILGDTGISGQPGQFASPFGTLLVFLVRTGRGP